MMIPLAIGMAAVATIKSKGVKPVDPKTAAERRVVYEAALACKDVDKLRVISAAFRAEGCVVEADMLDKRIALRLAPPEVRDMRKQALRKGLKSQDPVKVRELADAFEEIGATGAAADLNRYATGLETAMRSEVEGMTDGEV